MEGLVHRDHRLGASPVAPIRIDPQAHVATPMPGQPASDCERERGHERGGQQRSRERQRGGEVAPEQRMQCVVDAAR